jgi:hypothetical protein
LEKLLIGHNGLGGCPSWHLSLVEVVEEASGRVTYFAADRCGAGFTPAHVAKSFIMTQCMSYAWCVYTQHPPA